MLDSDLARLYECANGTKDINKAVKRNLERFPKEFYFQLTKEEVKKLSLRFQIGTLNNQGNFRGQHLKYLPYVFTEQGVAMLSSVLHTKRAIDTSIKIMDAFVALRHYYVENKDIYKTLNNINDKLIDYDKKFDYIFSKFDKKEFLFLPGEVYDSYSELINILSTASKEVIIIDSYADKSMLDIIRNFSVNFILVTKNKSK